MVWNIDINILFPSIKNPEGILLLFFILSKPNCDLLFVFLLCDKLYNYGILQICKLSWGSQHMSTRHVTFR